MAAVVTVIEVGNAPKADIERPGLKCREVPQPERGGCDVNSRRAALRRRHPSQKKADWPLLRMCRTARAETGSGCQVPSTALGAGKSRFFLGYHLPACAPPSTCKISPVVNVASVKNKTASTTSLISPILPTGGIPF